MVFSDMFLPQIGVFAERSGECQISGMIKTMVMSQGKNRRLNIIAKTLATHLRRKRKERGDPYVLWMQPYML